MFIYENQAPIFRQHPHDSWRLYLWDRLAHSLVQGSVQKITISLMVVLHCTCSQFKSQLYINSFFICDVTSEVLSMLPFLVGCKNVIHCEAWPLCVQFSLTSGPDQELLEEKKKKSLGNLPLIQWCFEWFLIPPICLLPCTSQSTEHSVQGISLYSVGR